MSTDVTLSLGYSFLLSFTAQDPLLSPAQHQLIQKIITAQTAQRNDHDILQIIIPNFSNAWPGTLAISTELPIVTSTMLATP